MPDKESLPAAEPSEQPPHHTVNAPHHVGTTDQPYRAAHRPAAKKRTRHTGWLTVGLVVVVVAVSLLWNFFIIQQYQVDGPSMQPTLYTGNRLLVDKLPKTWARLTGHPYIPARGDIVVFVEKNLQGLSETGSDQLIKRVIGLPGDRVVVKNGTVTIYNKQHPGGFDPDKTLPYGKTIGATPDNIDITVPPNNIFVMGDHRDDSLDSRVFGPVPVKNIIGQLVLRITPLSKFERF